MNERGKLLAIWGAVLQLGAVVGLIGTIFSMLRAFARVTQSEIGQPEALVSDMAIALHATMIGAVVSLVGIVLLLVALFSARYRAPWFQTVLWILSILWLLSFPVGTVLGIVVIVYLINHKGEFTAQGHAEGA